MTPLKFDKRLRDKLLKSGELTQDELTAHFGDLEDVSEGLRYRIEESEETEEEAPQVEESNDEQSEG